MGQGSGQVLRDGTALSDLVDRDQRLLAARVWSDPELFDLEMEHLFARAWVPLAHESELTRPGDFVVRAIGLDQVIVSRGPEGGLHVLLNACAHRGATVCRAEVGNAATFKCPFHGWVYGSDGALLGVPFDRLVYGDGVDKATHGLRRARVGVVDGIVFATWDESAPALEDEIGDFRPYLDTMLCRTDGGMVVTGPPQRYVIDANWKIVAEGFFGDVYHVITVHQSLADIGVAQITDDTFQGYKVSVNGHGLQCPDHTRHGQSGEPMEVLRQAPPVGLSPELVGQLEQHLSPAQIELLARTPPSIAGLFPTGSLVYVGGGMSASTTIASFRFFTPISVDRTELTSFTLVERDASPELKAALHQTTISTFGIGGIFESDDMEVWAAAQRPTRGVMGRRQQASYQSRGTPCEPALPGSVHATRGVSGDDNAWLFYERWLGFLEDGAR